MNDKKNIVNKDYRKALLWNCTNGIVSMIDQEFKKEKIIEMQMDVKLLNIVIGTPLWILGPYTHGLVATGKIAKVISKNLRGGVGFSSMTVEIIIEKICHPRSILQQDGFQCLLSSSNEVEQFQWINQVSSEYLFSVNAANNIKAVKSTNVRRYGLNHTGRNHACTGYHKHCSGCGMCYTNIRNCYNGHM
jgi:hypothetical protein